MIRHGIILYSLLLAFSLMPDLTAAQEEGSGDTTPTPTTTTTTVPEPEICYYKKQTNGPQSKLQQSYGTIPGVNNTLKCQEYCQRYNDCYYFVLNTEKGSCNLKNDLANSSTVVSNKHIFGPKFCPGDDQNEVSQQPQEPELPLQLVKPHIIIIGQTGAGKSSLSNVLLGGHPTCQDCTFKVCVDGLDSCTKDTAYNVGTWIGLPENPHATVVDTPGFGDSKGTEEQVKLLKGMMNVLNNIVKTADAIVLHIKAKAFTRIDGSMHNMLQQLTSLFGTNVWDKIIINFGWFSYNGADILSRGQRCQFDPSLCRDEEWLVREVSKILVRDYGEYIERNLTFTFIDSFSQQKWNKPDLVQQQHFKLNTDRLWEFATAGEELPLQTIDDVLAGNLELRRNVTNLQNDHLQKLEIIEGYKTELNALKTQNVFQQDELTQCSLDRNTHKQNHLECKNNTEDKDTTIGELSVQVATWVVKYNESVIKLTSLEGDLDQTAQNYEARRVISETLSAEKSALEQKVTHCEAKQITCDATDQQVYDTIVNLTNCNRDYAHSLKDIQKLNISLKGEMELTTKNKAEINTLRTKKSICEIAKVGDENAINSLNGSLIEVRKEKQEKIDENYSLRDQKNSINIDKIQCDNNLRTKTREYNAANTGKTKCTTDLDKCIKKVQSIERPSRRSAISLGQRSKGHKTIYKVTCVGQCQAINLELSSTSGDIDLFARERGYPTINNKDCQDCSACRSWLGSGSKDKCTVFTSGGNLFYLTAHAYSSYANGQLIIEGDGIEKIQLIN